MTCALLRLGGVAEVRRNPKKIDAWADRYTKCDTRQQLTYGELEFNIEPVSMLKLDWRALLVLRIRRIYVQRPPKKS